jgi:hypothetical protein
MQAPARALRTPIGYPRGVPQAGMLLDLLADTACGMTHFVTRSKLDFGHF